MKAVRVTEFGLDRPMSLDEVPEPVPGRGQVRVRVRAAGVNPLEIAIRSGNHPRAKQMSLPYVCGTDVAGEVEAVGEGVEGYAAGGRIAPGDRVWGRTAGGAYAERALLAPPLLGRLPEALSWAEGAALPIPLLTAWNALVIKAGAGPGETVLIQGGAGGVGHLAIQLARRMGCRVFATVSSEEKAALCREAGAEAAINYREEDVAGRVMELTGGRGVDAVAETAACANLPGDLRLIAVDGRIVVIGTGTGKGPDVTIPVPAAMTRDARVLALSSGNLAPHLPEAMRRLAPLLASGAIRPRVGAELPLAEADAAHALVLSGKFLGKVALIP